MDADAFFGQPLASPFEEFCHVRATPRDDDSSPLGHFELGFDARAGTYSADAEGREAVRTAVNRARAVASTPERARAFLHGQVSVCAWQFLHSRDDWQSLALVTDGEPRVTKTVGGEWMASVQFGFAGSHAGRRAGELAYPAGAN